MVSFGFPFKPTVRVRTKKADPELRALIRPHHHTC